MRRTLALSLVALLGLAGLAGCGDDDGPSVGTGAGDETTVPAADGPAPADDPLAGRTFSVEGDAIVAGTTVTVSFRDGAVIAETGCNRLSGQYALADGTLTTTDLMGTEMGCGPDLMAQEGRVRDLLQRSNEVAVTGGEVTLSGDGDTWVLTEQGAPPTQELVGPTWTLDTLFAGSEPSDAASSVPQGVTASITFADDGTYAVEAGCNTGSGTYAEAGTGIYAIDAPALTRRRCDAAAMEVENALVDVLDGEVALSIEGDLLTITATGGDGTGLRFTAT